MDTATAKFCDDALALVEDAVQASLELHTKAADLESRLVGEKVLLEKVASLEKRASGVISFEPALLDEATVLLARTNGGENQDAVKLATVIKQDPNVALQLLIKVASSLPRVQALNEGVGIKPTQPSEGNGRWV